MSDKTGLDYEIVFNDGEWQVWTPDDTGGIIGIGNSEEAAMCDAISNMRALIEVFWNKGAFPK